MMKLRIGSIFDTGGLELIVDSREQKPLWEFIKRTKMFVGDYTTNILQHHFVIERKSPQDLYGTLTKGHRRFRNQILRAQEKKITMVVYVESSRKKFLAKDFPRGHLLKFPSISLDRMIKTMEKRYQLEFVWCRDRNDMRKKVIERLNIETANYERSTKKRKK